MQDLGNILKQIWPVAFYDTDIYVQTRWLSMSTGLEIQSAPEVDHHPRYRGPTKATQSMPHDGKGKVETIQNASGHQRILKISKDRHVLFQDIYLDLAKYEVSCNLISDRLGGINFHRPWRNFCNIAGSAARKGAALDQEPDFDEGHLHRPRGFQEFFQPTSWRWISEVVGCPMESHGLWPVIHFNGLL